MFSRLRFFFGRGQPKDIAAALAPDAVGANEPAERIKELLRSSSLEFKEPKGPIDGLLYSFFPNLIFSPRCIQNIIRHQFGNALVFDISLLALAVFSLVFSRETVGWVGLFFALLFERNRPQRTL